MENRSLKIFLACAIGAGIGTMLAAEMNRYFWWVGCLAGGFAGYLTHDFKGVLKAVSRAGRETWGNLYAFHYKDAFEQGTICFVWLSNLLIPALIILAYLPAKDFGFGIFTYTILILFCLGGSAFFGLSVAKEVTRRERELNPSYRAELSYPGYKIDEGIIRVNPFRTYFHAAKCLVMMALEILTALKDLIIAAKLIPSFLYRIFILIHSEIRLLCGIDAMIGAIAGYFIGSAMIGALIGGALGVINYELVSKRLLKIVPAG